MLDCVDQEGNGFTKKQKTEGEEVEAQKEKILVLVNPKGTMSWIPLEEIVQITPTSKREAAAIYNFSSQLGNAGGFSETSITLESGWNMVGYNSQNAKTVAESMISIKGKYNSVWTYDAYAGQWLRYIPNGQSFLNDLEFMQPGRGYWIDAKERCMWDVGP